MKNKQTVQYFKRKAKFEAIIDINVCIHSHNSLFCLPVISNPQVATTEKLLVTMLLKARESNCSQENIYLKDVKDDFDRER